MLDHWQPECIGTIRRITAVQGNGYWYSQNEDGRRYWSTFVKRSELEFHEDGSFTMRPAYNPTQHACQMFWRLQIVDAGA